jgi:hypothetical protein
MTWYNDEENGVAALGTVHRPCDNFRTGDRDMEWFDFGFLPVAISYKLYTYIQ